MSQTYSTRPTLITYRDSNSRPICNRNYKYSSAVAVN